jgi:hydroxyacylglutathione hydrolase
MIIEQILVTQMAVFCYLVADEKSGDAVLIDPAGDHHAIESVVTKHKATIKYIINTHGHFDHTSGNDYWIKKSGAPLLLHETDVRKLGSLTSRFFSRAMGGKTSPPPQMTIKEGDVISFGACSLKVIHTPGHSEGSVCLYTPGNIFTGDTLFTEGMGRTDLPDGSMKKIMDSIRNKILSLPDDTVIWPGHHYGRYPTSTVREQKRYYQ